MDRIADFVMEYMLSPILLIIAIAFCVAFIIGVPLGIYAWVTYVPPETFSLRVDSWKCTKSYDDVRKVCIKGVCNDWTYNVCEQWSAK